MGNAKQCFYVNGILLTNMAKLRQCLHKDEDMAFLSALIARWDEFMRFADFHFPACLTGCELLENVVVARDRLMASVRTAIEDSDRFAGPLPGETAADRFIQAVATWYQTDAKSGQIARVARGYRAAIGQAAMKNDERWPLYARMMALYVIAGYESSGGFPVEKLRLRMAAPADQKRDDLSFDEGALIPLRARPRLDAAAPSKSAGAEIYEYLSYEGCEGANLDIRLRKFVCDDARAIMVVKHPHDERPRAFVELKKGEFVWASTVGNRIVKIMPNVRIEGEHALARAGGAFIYANAANERQRLHPDEEVSAFEIRGAQGWFGCVGINANQAPIAFNDVPLRRIVPGRLAGWEAEAKFVDLCSIGAEWLFLTSDGRVWANTPARDEALKNHACEGGTRDLSRDVVAIYAMRRERCFVLRGRDGKAFCVPIERDAGSDSSRRLPDKLLGDLWLAAQDCKLPAFRNNDYAFSERCAAYVGKEREELVVVARPERDGGRIDS